MTSLRLLLAAALTLLPVAVRAQRCVCVATSGGDLNVREGPGTSFPILGSASINNCFRYSGSSGGWDTVEFQGRTAYVSSDFTSTPHPCADSVNHPRCAHQVCSSNTNRNPRNCDAQGCGHYGAPRGSRSHAGSDVRCSAGDAVYAPYDGVLVREAKPYGDGSCCDTGWLFQVDEQWENESGQMVNFQVMGFYSRPDHPNNTPLRKGERMATHVGLHCGCYSTTMTDHCHFQVIQNPSAGSSATTDATSYAYCSVL